MQNRGKFIYLFAVLFVSAIVIGLLINRSHKTVGMTGPEVNSGRDGRQTAASKPAPHIHRNGAPVADTADDDADEPNPMAFSKEKVEEYLQKHNRNAASLLAAFHALKDTNLLCEAATNFPNDSHVQWTVLTHDAFPEDRRKWLDAFKASSPSNSLANYISAREYFKNKQPDVAMNELAAASSKTQFADFSMETLLDQEELSRFNGDTAMMTGIKSMAAMADDLLGGLGDFKGVATGIGDLQKQYVISGDTGSIQNLAQMGMQLSDHLMGSDGGKFLISQLVGIASGTIVLQSLDQNTPYDFLGGKTPAQKIEEFKQERAEIRDLTKNQPWSVLMSEEKMAAYWERVKVYGEVAAIRWAQQQQTESTPSNGN